MRISALCLIFFAFFCLPSAFAADQVLIMAIGEYPGQPLPGVKHDVDNALGLARKLGFDTSQAVVLRDEQLTHAGLRQALGQLKERTRKNDRVFIHYSGHGTSYYSGGKCVQALVPIDTKADGRNLFDLATLTSGLDAIKALTRDVIVVIDACHSGGLREIAMRGGGDTLRFRPRVWTAASGERCNAPINVPRQWGEQGIATRGGNRPESNFVFFAAANEREVALDNPDRGGFASSALLECAMSGVADSDGSQGISAAELAACAQGRIDDEVRKINQQHSQRYKPQRVEVYGNAARNLALPIVGTPDSVDSASRTIAAFQQIAAGSNGNWKIEIGTSAGEVQLDQPVGFSYSSSQPGYASVLYVGSDRQDIQALLTNKPVSASGGSLGRTKISAPAGENVFLVILSQTPLDLDAVLRNGKVAIETAVLQGLQAAATASSSRNASKMVADPAATVSGYAARLVTVRGR